VSSCLVTGASGRGRRHNGLSRRQPLVTITVGIPIPSQADATAHIAESMSRVFDFPVEIDTDNIRATLDKGLLKIRVPKASVGRRRVIRIARPGDELTIKI
jgi:hypothetical protein